MAKLSQIIEDYLLEELVNGDICIQRLQLANTFNCVPSQINYVLNTRFTLERGYILDSQRGEGGYIRIYKIKSPNKDIIEKIIQQLNLPTEEKTGLDYLYNLVSNNIIDEGQFDFFKDCISAKTLNNPYGNENIIRSQILSSILKRLLLH